jgi:hypothetical protein
MTLGIVRKENKDVYHKYSISKSPTMILLKPNEKRPQVYKGEMNYNAIFDFLNIHSEQYVVGGGSTFETKGDKPWLNESIPELTSKSANDICLNTNGVLCVIIFNNDKPSKTALDTAKEVRRLYDNKIDRGLKYNFMWINAGTQKGWKSAFEITSVPSVLILNPGKRKRFIKIDGDLHFGALSKSKLILRQPIGED